MRKLSFFLCMLLLLPSMTAEAYIGPGVGAGSIVVVLGILASIFMAFVAILWYPVKRLIKGRNSAKRGSAAKQDSKAS